MDARALSSPPASWLHQLGPRLRTLWWWKFAGTTVGMTVFFVVYFQLLHHPLFPLTIMPLTAVDRWIEFRPEALYLYVSLWFYVSLAPALLVDRRELVSYGLAAIVLSAIGLGIFLVWPTAVPASDLVWPHRSIFSVLQKVDASGNACPSLHVAFAVFSAIWFERILREMNAGAWARGGNWAWCAGILYSTVAIRQHVALDVLAGAVLGAAVAAGHLWILRAAPAD